MPTPTTVEEYLRQVPNPAPCPHSPATTDPPCHDCIAKRIATAIALRAGQDPSVALGLAPPTNGQAQPAATAPAQSSPVEATAAPPEEEPVGEEVNPDDFDDDGFPLSAEAKAARDAGRTMQPGGMALPPEAERVELPMPGMQALLDQAEPNPLLPGMTRTEPQPMQAPDPAELLAGMTGGQIETTPPQMVTEGTTTRPLAPLELSPEQMQRRNEIEAGVHPAVAPLVPRGEIIGYAQKGYEPGEQIVWPGPPPVTLPVGEPLAAGDPLMVATATGLVVKFVDGGAASLAPQADPTPPSTAPPEPSQYVTTQRNSHGVLYGWTGTEWVLVPEESAEAPSRPAPVDEGAAVISADTAAPAPSPELAERKPLHPAGHRDALIKYVKAHWPDVTVDKDNVSYIVIDLLASLVVLQRMNHEALDLVELGVDPLNQIEGETGALPQPTGADKPAPPLSPDQVPPTQPSATVGAPPAQPAPDSPITAAAAVAAPVQVDPALLTQHCAHGMPGTDFSTNPPRSASCVDCMNDGGPPPAMSKLHAERFQMAHLQTQCARAVCNRTIEVGQIIGLVPQVGWCCAVCTKPDRPTAPAA